MLPATLDKGIGGVGEEYGSMVMIGSKNGGKGQVHSPSPSPLNLGSTIVDKVGSEDVDCDNELEANVEHSS